MTWSTGWTSKMRLPPRLATSSTSARLIQKTSGLFNTGPADDLKSSFKPSADDLLSSLDTEVFPLDFNATGMLGCLEDPLAEASLDSFVDINAFFNEGKQTEPMDGAAEIDALIEKTKPVAVATETVVEVTAAPSRKRKFEEIEVVDVVSMETEEVVTTTPDHDYVTKRPRLSTSSVVSDDMGASSSGGSPAPVSTEMKYRERRDKNNVASRRSREIRKMKFVDMEEKADELVVENKRLEVKIVELEKLAKEMKAILVAKLAGK